MGWVLSGLSLGQGFRFLAKGFQGVYLGQKQPWNPGRCLLVRMTGRERACFISRLPSIWSRYLALAWESTWYPGWAEQHADYLVITSHFTYII